MGKNTANLTFADELTRESISPPTSGWLFYPFFWPTTTSIETTPMQETNHLSLGCPVQETFMESTFGALLTNPHEDLW